MYTFAKIALWFKSETSHWPWSNEEKSDWLKAKPHIDSHHSMCLLEMSNLVSPGIPFEINFYHFVFVSLLAFSFECSFVKSGGIHFWSKTSALIGCIHILKWGQYEYNLRMIFSQSMLNNWTLTYQNCGNPWRKSRSGLLGSPDST